MYLTGRHESIDLDGYRYGFNGMELDDEIKGQGDSYDFGARMYDSRLGRWFAMDPHSKKYPWSSSYVFANNNPLYYIDPDGKDTDPALLKLFLDALKNGPELMAQNRIIFLRNAAMSGHFSDGQSGFAKSSGHLSGSKYQFEEGTLSSMSSANSMTGPISVNLYGKNIDGFLTYQKRKDLGFTNIYNVNFLHGKDITRPAADSHGQSGFFVELINSANNSVLKVDVRTSENLKFIKDEFYRRYNEEVDKKLKSDPFLKRTNDLHRFYYQQLQPAYSKYIKAFEDKNLSKESKEKAKLEYEKISNKYKKMLSAWNKDQKKY